MKVCWCDAFEEVISRVVAAFGILELPGDASGPRASIYHLHRVGNVLRAREDARGHDEVACRALAELESSVARVIDVDVHLPTMAQGAGHSANRAPAVDKRLRDLTHDS